MGEVCEELWSAGCWVLSLLLAAFGLRDAPRNGVIRAVSSLSAGGALVDPIPSEGGGELAELGICHWVCSDCPGSAPSGCSGSCRLRRARRPRDRRPPSWGWFSCDGGVSGTASVVRVGCSGDSSSGPFRGDRGPDCSSGGTNSDSSTSTFRCEPVFWLCPLPCRDSKSPTRVPPVPSSPRALLRLREVARLPVSEPFPVSSSGDAHSEWELWCPELPRRGLSGTCVPSHLAVIGFHSDGWRSPPPKLYRQTRSRCYG